MSYQFYVDSLSQHGKDLLVEHAIDEPSLAIISLKDLERVGMRLGDLAKTKQFLGVAKRPRESEDDDDVHGRAAETASRPSPNFTSVKEAFNVVSQCPILQAYECAVDELSAAVKRYNEDCIKEALVSAVMGASGQGKTDALNLIRKDAGMQAKMINAINEHEQPLKCEYVIPLFATFNQGSTYDGHKETTIVNALCNRLLSNYIGVECNVSQSKQFGNVTLEQLIAFIRQREADERDCEPDEVCVIVLVDDVHTVNEGAESAPCDSMGIMLDVICSTQQVALRSKKLTFAVVTSLQVNSMYARVSFGSPRPLHSIPLNPCCASDIDDMVDKIIEFAEKSGEHSMWPIIELRYAGLRTPLVGTSARSRS